MISNKNDVHKPELDVLEGAEPESERKTVTKIVFKIEIDKLNV